MIDSPVGRRKILAGVGAATLFSALRCSPLLSMQDGAASGMPEGDVQKTEENNRKTDYDDRQASRLLDQRTHKATEAGLKFLASRQNDRGEFQRGPYAANVAVVGLAGMAFLSQGSAPMRGEYSQSLIRCRKFIIRHCQANGFITNKDAQSHGPMYGHGFATLFLAEVYGAAASVDAKETLKRAVQLIVDTQNEDGGWRYQPQRDDADVSVTICQVMALRAARNVGIYVPNETIERCVEFIKKSQNGDGGFMYMLDGGPSAFPRTAAGVVALLSAGVYEGKEIEQGMKFLMKNIPKRERGLREAHYFYGHYYAIQAMWHAGGRQWQTWNRAIRDDLLDRQQRDGSWLDGISAEYGTAMACIILQVPNNCLPIFQR